MLSTTTNNNNNNNYDNNNVMHSTQLLKSKYLGVID